jgi:hypothetical protein
VLAGGTNVADCTHAGPRTFRSRTGVGWSDGGATVTLLTVHAGRNRHRFPKVGLTHHQAAAALAHAGATDGVLVNGGASTTMEVRTRLPGRPRRVDAVLPRYYSERPVPNGLAIVLR